MKRTMKLASRGKRLGAGLIDMALPFVVYVIMISKFGMPSNLPGRGYGFDDYYGFGYGYGFGFDYNYNLPQTRGTYALMLILFVLMVAYIIAQLVLFAKAQSIGKAILGLQVVSSKDGKPFGFWKMMLREFIVKSASSSVFLLGYIWILIDDRNRGWHDKILDSYVVDLKETASMYRRASIQTRPSAPVRQEATKDQYDYVDATTAPTVSAAPATPVAPVVEEVNVQEAVAPVAKETKTEEAIVPVAEERKDERPTLPVVEEIKTESPPVTVEPEVSIIAAGDEQKEISEKEEDTE